MASTTNNGHARAIASAWTEFFTRHRQGDPGKQKPSLDRQYGSTAKNRTVEDVRKEWIDQLTKISPYSLRNWPETTDEVGQLKLLLDWRSSDMWGTVERSMGLSAQNSERRGKPDLPSYAYENWYHESQKSQKGGGNAREKEKEARSKPIPKDAEPTVHIDDQEQYIGFLRPPLVWIRPMHKEGNTSIKESQKARAYAVKKSLTTMKEFYAISEEYYLTELRGSLERAQTEEDLQKIHDRCEKYHRKVADILYEEWDRAVLKWIKDKEGGVQDSEDAASQTSDDDTKATMNKGAETRKTRSSPLTPRVDATEDTANYQTDINESFMAKWKKGKYPPSNVARHEPKASTQFPVVEDIGEHARVQTQHLNNRGAPGMAPYPQSAKYAPYNQPLGNIVPEYPSVNDDQYQLKYEERERVPHTFPRPSYPANLEGDRGTGNGGSKTGPQFFQATTHVSIPGQPMRGGPEISSAQQARAPYETAGHPSSTAPWLPPNHHIWTPKAEVELGAGTQTSSRTPWIPQTPLSGRSATIGQNDSSSVPHSRAPYQQRRPPSHHQRRPPPTSAQSASPHGMGSNNPNIGYPSLRAQSTNIGQPRGHVNPLQTEDPLRGLFVGAESAPDSNLSEMWKAMDELVGGIPKAYADAEIHRYVSMEEGTLEPQETVQVHGINTEGVDENGSDISSFDDSGSEGSSLQTESDDDDTPTPSVVGARTSPAFVASNMTPAPQQSFVNASALNGLPSSLATAETTPRPGRRPQGQARSVHFANSPRVRFF
ncbi:hypothetical protein BDZ97DRAFT_1920561 [Flammula alnicola]|nr:hypothetical protein BDZ97DRAFT_1920561 [Flammula alnicola]